MAAVGQEPAPEEATPAEGGESVQVGKAVDPQKMYKAAAGAEENLEQLATLMGQAQAPDATVNAVESMAKAMRQLMASMSKAPTPEPEPKPAPRSIGEATNELAANARQQ